MLKYFCFIFLLISELCYVGMSQNQFEISDLDYTSNQVIVDFAKKMQKKGLHACGLGGREDKGKVMDFDVTFQYDKVLDISNARELIVETVLLLVDEINNNKTVRQYLYHYPFTPEDVIVSILPNCSVLNDQACESTIRVRAQLGRISYYGAQNPYVNLHKETFEEAKQILNK